jgi:hypothetical protein
LPAPATKDTCRERSSDSGDLFVCTVAPSIPSDPDSGEAWRISTERAESVRHRPVDRDNNMDQQMPAVRCRRHVLHEQIVHAIVGIAICEREIECPLHLSTELTCLSLSLSTRGKTIG